MNVKAENPQSAIPFRCFQIDVARQPERPEEIVRLVEQGAEFGFNACMMYLENGLAIPAFGAAADPDALTPEDCRAIQDRAKAVGVELIASLNLLGHNENILAHETFRHLAEARQGFRRRDQQFRNDLCPSLPETRELAAAAVRETAEIFDSKLLHVGLDETWTIGSCPLCRERAAQGGLGGIFADWVRFLHGEVAAAGKRMAMWADMLFVYHDTPWDTLPRDILMVDWYYPHVPHLPALDFFNWRRVDTVRQLHERGFEIVLGGATDAANNESLLRSSAGVPIYGFLATQWEGSSVVQDVYAAGRFATGRLLTEGVRPAAGAVGAALTSGPAADEARGCLLQQGLEASSRHRVSAAGKLSYTVEEAAVAAFDESCALLSAWRKAFDPSPVTEAARLGLLRSAFFSGWTVVLNEAALLARQCGGDAIDPLQAARLRHNLATVRALFEQGHTLAATLNADVRAGLRRSHVLSGWSGAEEAFSESARRIEQVIAGSGNPFTELVLVVELLTVDYVTHELEIGTAGADGKFEQVLHTYCAPIRPQGAAFFTVPLAAQPHQLRLRVGGYGRVGVTCLRLESAAGTRLPARLVKAEGQVIDPQHLLHRDARAAFFNESGVQAKWLDPACDPVHAVTLTF